MPFILDFRKPQTRVDVAQFLGLQPNELDAAIESGLTPSAPSSPYIRHRIPKRRGGVTKFRTVWDIHEARLRDAHRAFAWRFDQFARDVLADFPRDSTYGYVRGRSIKDNASQHCGHRLLLRCDLRDFFPTISRDRLVARFIQLGIVSEVAEALAGFATIEGKLALGLNASPMLANLVCSDLDRKLEELATDSSCAYSRYADDIAISGQALPLSGKVVEIIESEGFRLSAKKMRVTTVGQAHFVTGLSVSDPHGPHVPRHFKKRLRQELHYCAKHGIQNHLERRNAGESYQSGINRIDGSVRFVFSIESAGTRMRETWRKALIADSAEVTYGPVHDRTGVQTTFLIDETEFERNGTWFLAVACVTTEHIDKVRTHVKATLRQHLMDPFSPGKKKPLEKKGLHFTDAPESLRNEYVIGLPYLQFRAYIAFAELPDRKSYPAVYTKLLQNLLPRRFKSYDRSQVAIYFEENPSIPVGELSALVGSLYDALEQNNERRPVVPPKCAVRGKSEEPAFSLPDSLLWIFARTFASTQASDADYLRFERLRDKYRHIINVDTGELFSRRHPIEMKRAT